MAMVVAIDALQGNLIGILDHDAISSQIITTGAPLATQRQCAGVAIKSG